MELVSVVIPTYNRDTLILESIESVFEQTYRNIECIIVDDGSTDNTEQVITKLNDARVKYYKLERNSGACIARNYGVTKAGGKYIAFQDSDDLWHKTKIEDQVSWLKKHNADMVFCRLETEGEKKGKSWFLPPNKFHTLHISHQFAVSDFLGSTQTFLLKRECFEKIRFDAKLPRFQDYDFLIQAAIHYKVVFLDKTLAIRRVGVDSISSNHNKGIIGCEYLLNKYKKEYETARRMKSKLYFFEACYLYQLGKDAGKMINKSFKTYPFDIKNDIKFILYRLGLWKLFFPIVD